MNRKRYNPHIDRDRIEWADWLINQLYNCLQETWESGYECGYGDGKFDGEESSYDAGYDQCLRDHFPREKRQ